MFSFTDDEAYDGPKNDPRTVPHEKGMDGIKIWEISPCPALLPLNPMHHSPGGADHVERTIKEGNVMTMGPKPIVIGRATDFAHRTASRHSAEMGKFPDIAIIQHESDVMQVAHHYFEDGIMHFTRRINKCISLGCANGEVAPSCAGRPCRTLPSSTSC
ncbi:hypothetical protein D9615_010183 [Tricholomella constricta]|uniref:Glycosyltransferase 2-like domain-containing protein n=1 Tax=Tricholomella constricta TaxID=117010 RepID=A0A8H5GNB2_9AGAR|nr:hypothetical protein D9615_010183 [Tricholomella constricta]